MDGERRLLIVFAVAALTGAAVTMAATGMTPWTDTASALERQAADLPYDSHVFGVPGDGAERYHGPYRVDGRTYFVTASDGSVVAADGITAAAQDTAARVTALHDLYRTTRTDPLLYSPGAARTNISHYRDFEQRLLLEVGDRALHPAGMTGRERLYDDLFGDGTTMVPYRTLGNLSRVGRATDRFYDEASWTAAQDLLDAYDAATDAYRADLQDTLTVFNRTLDRGPDGTVQNSIYQYQMGASTNLTTVLDAFRTVAGNVDALDRAVDRRGAILAGDRDPDITVPAVTLPGDRPDRIFDASDTNRLFAERKDGAESPPGTDAYDVRLACLNQTHLVQRPDPGGYPDLMTADSVLRVVIYPFVEDEFRESFGPELDPYRSRDGRLTIGNEDIAVTDRNTSITVTDRDTGRTVTIDAEVARRGGDGVGRAVPVTWTAPNATLAGVLTETDFVFTDCNCPFLEIPRLQWNTAHMVDDRLDDPVLADLSDDEIRSIEPAAVRDAARAARDAERAFRDEPGITTLEPLSSAYTALYIRTMENSDDGIPPALHERLPALWEVAGMAEGRVAAMERTVGQYHRLMDAGYGKWIFNDVPRGEFDDPAEVMDAFGPAEVLGYSMMGLVFSPGSSAVWRSDTAPTFYTVNRYPPKRVLYSPNR